MIGEPFSAVKWVTRRTPNRSSTMVGGPMSSPNAAFVTGVPTAVRIAATADDATGNASHPVRKEGRSCPPLRCRVSAQVQRVARMAVLREPEVMQLDTCEQLSHFLAPAKVRAVGAPCSDDEIGAMSDTK